MPSLFNINTSNARECKDRFANILTQHAYAGASHARDAHLNVDNTVLGYVNLTQHPHPSQANRHVRIVHRLKGLHDVRF